MCDEGRLRLPLRQLAPSASSGRWSAQDGKLKPAPWATVLPATAQRVRRGGADATPAAVVGVLSPFLTCEEAYPAREVSSRGCRARCGLPRAGAGRRRGRHLSRRTAAASRSQPVKFTIRAEKCPNRRGVEAVLQHFQGEVIGVRRRAARRPRPARCRRSTSPAAIRRAPGGWISEEQATALAKVPLLIVQDLFAVAG